MSNPILIIGAGISGLALAQGFLKHNIPFRIYERDANLTARTQGYRVRITDDGIDALRQNLSPERFKTLERRCCALLTASTGNVPQFHLDAATAGPINSPFKPPGDNRNRPVPVPTTTTGKPWSADRTALREVLSLGLDDLLQFGKEFDSYEQTAEGVSVTFQDGSIVHGCAIVGADGAWSRVRQQLMPSYTLLDTEGRLIFGKTDVTDEFRKRFSTAAITGMSLIKDSQRGFFCLLEPMFFDKTDEAASEDYVYWVLMSRKDQWQADEEMLRLGSPGTVKLVQSLISEWHPSLRPLFDTQKMAVMRVVSSPPTLPTWSSDARVTLVGDAIHSMSPTAALGATTALQDTGTLVRRMLEVQSSEILTAFERYEGEMREYSGVALKKSLMGGKVMFRMKDFEELPTVK